MTAKDKASGKTQSIKIEASSGLKEDEIKKMQADAELHAEEDKKKKDVADVKNTAEMVTYTAEKALKDLPAPDQSGGQAGNEALESIKKSVSEKIATLRGMLKDLPAPDQSGGQAGGTDLDAIKKATEELSSEMSKIGEAISKAPNEPARPHEDSGAGGEQPSEVRDAEFKEGDKPAEGEAK